jgi:dTDP-4-amino-4,6-dideoxygalactose transaminase
MIRVPMTDLPAQHRELKGEILARWEAILDSGAFVGGREVEAFEEAFGNACATPHCVAVSCGTDALCFILRALGLEPGDEVITVANTFIATAAAISQAGGRAVFVDVEPGTCTLDPAKLSAAVTPRTRGILPVHLYGQTADMDVISDFAGERGLWVVEDACQAHLAEYRGHPAGSLGVAGAFSFYPAKNLGACGEAGAVVTADPDIAHTVRMLRHQGQSEKNVHKIRGSNGRCDALQAAALRVKLERLPGWNWRRGEIADRYRRRLAGLSGVELPVVGEGRTHVYHQFVIRLDRRDDVAGELLQRGVETAVHYPVPLHCTPPYRDQAPPEGSLRVTEQCARRQLSLPIYPEMTDRQVDLVCRELEQAVALHGLTAGSRNTERREARPWN